MLFATMILVSCINLGCTVSQVFGHDVCHENPHVLCRPAESIGTFPGNEEEVERACSILTQREKCWYDYAKNCRFQTVFKPEQDFESTIAYRLCKRDSILYKTLVSNAKCMKTAFNEVNEEYCLRYSNEKIQDNAGILKPLTDDPNQSVAGKDLRELRRCLKLASSFGCLIARMSEDCGDDARFLAQTVVSGMKVLEKSCDFIRYPVLYEATRIFELTPKQNTFDYIRDFQNKLNYG